MLDDMRKGRNAATLIITGIFVVVLALLSLACCGTREFFDAVDGFTPTPTMTATPDTCIPQCIALCEQIQAKHGNPSEVCVADCASVCEKAEAGE